jgi:DNA polymerase V
LGIIDPSCCKTVSEFGTIFCKVILMTPHETRAELLKAAVFDPVSRPIPVLGSRARLGFPSPADDFLDDTLDLNDWLVRNPAATFYYRAEGDSMLGAGIRSGDILIVDRSVTVQNGDLVLACWGGDSPICKIIQGLPKAIALHSANPDFPPLIPPNDAEIELFAITGVVRQVVRNRGSRVRPR